MWGSLRSPNKLFLNDGTDLQNFSFLNGIKYRLLCIGACFERDNNAVSEIRKSSHTHTHTHTNKRLLYNLSTKDTIQSHKCFPIVHFLPQSNLQIKGPAILSSRLFCTECVYNGISRLSFVECPLSDVSLYTAEMKL